MGRMGLRPRYVLLGIRVAVRCGTLEAGHRSDIGRCDFACSASLPALRRGMMVAFFHKSGISAWLSERFFFFSVCLMSRQLSYMAQGFIIFYFSGTTLLKGN